MPNMISNAPELIATLLELKTELENDPNAEGANNETDERMAEIGNILTILETFAWEDYKRVIIEHFGYPEDYFKN